MCLRKLDVMHSSNFYTCFPMPFVCVAFICLLSFAFICLLSFAFPSLFFFVYNSFSDYAYYLCSRWMNQPVPEPGVSESQHHLRTAFTVYYRDTYAFANSTWYMFVGPHWIDLGKEGKPYVLKLLRKKFYDKLIRPIVNYYRGRLRKRSRTYEKKMPNNLEYHKKQFQFTKIDSAFNNLESSFLKPLGWADLLGANPFLLGFKCGHVYDTRTHDFVLGFRPALPEDMIMKVLKHTKDEVMCADPVKAEFIRDVFSEIQPDKDAAKYLFDLFSYIISGRRSDQFFVIFQGGGANGKSVLEKLLISMLGRYCVTPDIKLLTKKGGQAEGADSKLMQCRGALVAVFQEPNAKDKLNSEKVKKYSGGDRIQAREIYKQAIEMVFTPLIIICCNWGLNIEDPSAGFMRRPQFVPFPTKFVERSEYDENNKSHKVMSSHVEANFELQEYGCQMLRIAMLNLIRMYKRHAELVESQAAKGINEVPKFLYVPDCIKKATKEYTSEKVPIKAFVEDRLVFVGQKVNGKVLRPQYSLSRKEMFDEFQNWVKDEGKAYDDVHQWNSSMLFGALATQNITLTNDGSTSNKNDRKLAFWNYCVGGGRHAVVDDELPLDVGPSARPPLTPLKNNINNIIVEEDDLMD